MAIELLSARVRLRGWQDSDVGPWIAMNADPVTTRFYERPWTPEESEQSFARNRDFLNEHTCGLWAAEELASGLFMGYVGVADRNHAGISFMPCREIGWRLHRDFWGKGYATEAARVVLAQVMADAAITEVFSYTAVINSPSINVMRKIGLRERTELAFVHPAVEPGHKLGPHIVYST